MGQAYTNMKPTPFLLLCNESVDISEHEVYSYWVMDFTFINIWARAKKELW